LAGSARIPPGAIVAVKAEIETRFLDPEEYSAWNDFVASSPDGSPFANTTYLDSFCAAAGGSYRVLVAEQGDSLLGGVALQERASRWGTVVEPRLMLQYNGFVLRAPQSSYPSIVTSQNVKILRALCEVIREQNYARCLLKSRTLTDGRVFDQLGWRNWSTYTYLVPLNDLEAQWGLVEKNLRRLVGRGEREGLVVTDDDDFDRFFDLHLDTHRRKGAPLYLPEAAFRRYFEELSRAGKCRLFHARQPDGTSIAAQLVLIADHEVTHTVSAAADPEKQKLGANPFLRWRVFETLAAEGYSANDLTDATLNPVTHFKSQLGGILTPSLAVEVPGTATARFGRTLERTAVRALAPLRGKS
jgi:hypothetical protein